MSRDYDVDTLRRSFDLVGQGIVASPSLGQRAAIAGRKRRLRRRFSALALAVAAVGVATAAGAGVWDRTSSPVGPSTAVLDCPTALPSPVNPGAPGEAMLPNNPGDMLVCTYSATTNASTMSIDYVSIGSRRISGADAVALATAINDAPPLERPRRCPMASSIDVLFFKNTSGMEAIAPIGGCTGTWNGTRLVDPALPLPTAPVAPSRPVHT